MGCQKIDILKNPGSSLKVAYSGVSEFKNLLGKSLVYGFRIYNPGIGKFLSVDPITKEYPELTPYQFASNRPIDGTDLDGKEWDYFMEPTSEGKTHLTVVANIDLKYNAQEFRDLGLNIDDYKMSLNSYFNQVLQNTSDNFFGQIKFNPDKSLNRSVPTVQIDTDKFNLSNPENALVIAGGTTGNYSFTKIRDKRDNILTPEEWASTAVHELLHTLRLDHPFEITQTPDSKLIHQGGNRYQTTTGTSNRIFFNIMNYPMISINSFNLGKINKQTGIENLTPGQVDFMKNEIDMQKQGLGVGGFTDPYYYNDPPGKKVQKNKNKE